jgi:hypothetical protein
VPALTRGNSENFLVTLRLDTKRKRERDELFFGFGFLSDFGLRSSDLCRT